MIDSVFPIRWSREAWEGAYGTPGTPHWRPWPHDNELREGTLREIMDAYYIPHELRDAWQQIKEDR